MFGLGLFTTLAIAFVLGYTLTVYTCAYIGKPDEDDKKVLVGVGLLWPLWAPIVLLLVALKWLTDAGDRKADAEGEEGWERLTNRMIRDKIFHMVDNSYQLRKSIRDLAQDEARSAVVDLVKPRSLK